MLSTTVLARLGVLWGGARDGCHGFLNPDLLDYLSFPWELDCSNRRIRQVNYSFSGGNTFDWAGLLFLQLARLSSSSLAAGLA